MTDPPISPDSSEAFRSRLHSPEGQAALDRLARLIVERAVDAMPPELYAPFSTEEGRKVLEEMWPEIVQAYFRGLSNPSR